MELQRRLVFTGHYSVDTQRYCTRAGGNCSVTHTHLSSIILISSVTVTRAEALLQWLQARLTLGYIAFNIQLYEQIQTHFIR